MSDSHQEWLERRERAGKALGLTPANETKDTDIAVWPGFIPSASVILVAGEPLARARLFSDLAARVSTGSDWVDGQKNGYWDVYTDTQGAEHRQWEDAGEGNTVAFASNRDAFTTQFRAYGGSTKYLKLGNKVSKDDLHSLTYFNASVVIADPIDMIGAGLSSEQRIKTFLESLRKINTAFLLGMHGSTRRQVAGSGAWQEADACWVVRADGDTLELEHTGGTLVMDVTPEGLRNGRTPDEKPVQRRTDAEWWLLGRMADGQKHLKQMVIEEAQGAGLNRKKVEHAFEKLGLRWENTHDVPRRTLWWRELSS